MSFGSSPWEQQGCPSCRWAWESASRQSLLYLGCSIELHTHLHQCQSCGALWEELERYTHVISTDEARAIVDQGTFELAQEPQGLQAK